MGSLPSARHKLKRAQRKAVSSLAQDHQGPEVCSGLNSRAPYRPHLRTEAVTDGHPLVGWRKRIKGDLRRMRKQRMEMLVEGFCHLPSADLSPSVRNISWYRVLFGFMAEVIKEALWIDFQAVTKRSVILL